MSFLSEDVVYFGNIRGSSRNSRNIFGDCFSRLGRLCSCRKEENLTVHAVDSVRLVYMRRIEEASVVEDIHSLQILDNERGSGLAGHKIIHRGRIRRKSDTIKALEKALKDYESKNKVIISSTALPESFIHKKDSKLSRIIQSKDMEELEIGIRNLRPNSKESSLQEGEMSHEIFRSGNITDEMKNMQSVRIDETPVEI